VSRKVAVISLAVLFAVAGILHFTHPAFFVRIVPTWVPDAGLAVSLSGIAEIAGAIGLLVPATRKAGAWGLILLLIAVFPANVHMLHLAMDDGSSAVMQAVLWLRLPLQPLLIWWLWRVSRM
jgi:uncharacterized membrane protein